MRKHHGSTKNRGSKPCHHVDGSGAVDRKVMQSLEAIGVLEKVEDDEGGNAGKKGGRRISRGGRRDLDRIALQTIEADEEEDGDDDE